MKVIKIGAEWCNGCLVMRPRWKELEAQNPWLTTEYHDYDTDTDLVRNYSVEGDKLPVFIFLDSNGHEILRLSGEIDKSKLESIIHQYRNS